MNSSSNIGTTIVSSITHFGAVKFGIAVIVNLILYRLHPIFGFLGTLFLFAIMVGLIH